MWRQLLGLVQYAACLKLWRASMWAGSSLGHGPAAAMHAVAYADCSTCISMPAACRYARLRQHCLAQHAYSVLGAWMQLLAAGRHRRRTLLRRCFSEWLELCQLTWKLLSKVRAAQQSARMCTT